MDNQSAPFNQYQAVAPTAMPVLPLNTIIISVVFLISLFLVLMRFDKLLKIKAIDDCARTSQFEKTITAAGEKYSYPVQDQYDACLKLKGVK
jgi:hypothetical protein